MAIRKQRQKKRNPSIDERDAEALLKADHRKVEELFAAYESVSATKKPDLVAKICNELRVHTLLEEEIFYPACREKGVEGSSLDEAQVEHDCVKVLISELMRPAPADAFHDAKVAVLREYVKHHVGEEERSSGGIFIAARKAGVDMNTVGRHLATRKQELLARAEDGSLDPPQPRSLSVQPEVQSQPTEEADLMASQHYRDRDDRGRFTEDNRGQYGRGRDDDRGYSQRDRYSRDEYGRFAEQDERGGYRSGGNYRDRDEYGRFVSDDDDRYGRYGSDYYRDERSRGYRDDDRYGEPGRGQGYRGSPRSRDEEGRFMSEDDRGSRGDYYRGEYYRGEDYRGDSRDRGQGGWFGDSEGHARAAEQRRGRGEPRGRERDDEDRGRSGGGERGWFGDSRGHAEAARRGWQNRG